MLVQRTRMTPFTFTAPEAGRPEGPVVRLGHLVHHPVARDVRPDRLPVLHVRQAPWFFLFPGIF